MTRDCIDVLAPGSLPEWYGISFSAERTARYHAARRGFFDSVYRWTLFLVVAFGTAGVSAVMLAWGSRVGIDATIMAAVTALIGAASLAFDPAGRARLHEALQRKAYELGAEVDSAIQPSAADCARWRAALHKIYAEEPPPKRALDAVAYNATLSGRREKTDDDLIVITLWQQIAKQFLPFASAKFPRRSEIKTGGSSRNLSDRSASDP